MDYDPRIFAQSKYSRRKVYHFSILSIQLRIVYLSVMALTICLSEL